MKKVILLLLFLLVLVVNVYLVNGSVSSILGLNVDCGSACDPIPVTATVQCVFNCAVNAAPSLTNANVLWGYSTGPTCRKSIDGGQTWSDCPDAHFSTLGVPVLANVHSIAEASDGSVIATVSDNTSPPDICVIVRSTDGGATWSKVFQSPPMRCVSSNGSSVDDSNHLICLSTGECVFVFGDQAGGTVKGKVIRSVDNGQTWSIVFNQTSSSDQPTTVAYDGNVGISCRYADSINTSISKGMRTLGGSVWVDTVFLSTSTILCVGGSFIFNGIPYVAGNRILDAVIVNGSTGNVDKVLNLPGANIASGVSLLALGYKNKATYIAAPDGTNGNRIGIWVSRDNWNTFAKIYTALPTMTGIQGGGAFEHPVNGCLYFYNRFNVISLC